MEFLFSRPGKVLEIDSLLQQKGSNQSFLVLVGTTKGLVLIGI